ncbi:MAG: hypothetical protein ACTH83_06135, partial [Lactococcus cremoris]
IKESRFIYDNGPIVNLESISTLPKIAEPEDKIHISMEVTDPTGVEYVHVSFRDYNEATLSTKLIYDDESKKYEGYIVIKDYILNGEMYLYEIEAKSKGNSNRTLIYSKKVTDDTFWREDFSKHSIQINGSHGPEFIQDSLSITESLDYEHLLEVSFTIKNSKYISRGLRIGFVGPNKDNSLYDNVEYFDIYRDSSGNFRGSYKLDKKYKEGIWRLKNINNMLIDENNEWAGHTIFKVPENSKFTLSKIINYKSYVNPSTLAINKNKLELGDILEISMKPNDFDEIANQITVILADKNGRVSEQGIATYYDQEKREYKGQFIIPSNYNLGEYFIDSILQYTNNDTTRIYNKAVYDESMTDLSKGDFSIVKSQMPNVFYTTIHDSNWMPEEKNGSISGRMDYNGSLEAIKISLDNSPNQELVKYRTHIQNKGWLGWVSNGELSCEESNRNKIEAIEVKLTDEMEKNYDIYYSMYVEEIGWLDWAKNGETAGTTGLRKGSKAIKIIITKKGDKAPGKTSNPYISSDELPELSYTTHIQSQGWQLPVTGGQMSGTKGESKRLEGIKISKSSPYPGEIQYRTHVQSRGWMGWTKEGQISGTEGESKRLEAIQIKLTGEISNKYDIYYRVHAEKNGWLGWAKNGEQAGTEGYARRLEAIEIVVVKKGAPAPGSTANPFDKKAKVPTISYTTHVQSIGWQPWVKDGKMAGTSGQAKRLEAIKIQMENLPATGGIQYKTHVQSFGWQNWSTNGALSGTSGKAKRLEAIQVQLTGEMAKKYDIYYRVHAQNYGWLGWAKNGDSAGTEGKAKRLEGIEIKLLKKDGKTPVSTGQSFIK